MFELKNKVALVTGAGSGMGKSHAFVLAAQGAKVIVTGKDLENCLLVADEIKSRGGEAACFKKQAMSPAPHFTWTTAGWRRKIYSKVEKIIKMLIKNKNYGT